MLRYINKVEWCAAKHLHLAVPMVDNLTVYCADYMPYEPLPMIGLAELEISDAMENGVRLWSTKLVLTLPERISSPSNPFSFRLTATDGTQYILGLSERPHPIVTFSDKHPNGANCQCACTMNVSLKGPIPALQSFS